MTEEGTRQAVDNLAASVHELTVHLAGLEAGREENAENIAALVDYGQRSRQMIRWLISTVVFDICLSLILAFATYTAVHASNEAKDATSSTKQIHQAAVIQCESGNEFRRADRARWQYVIDLSTNRPQTAEQQQQTREFLAYIDQADKLRDCTQIA